MHVTDIPDVITRNPPASPDAIRRLRAEVALELSDDYVALLAQADGVCADSFTLYPCEGVLERNVTFEVANYAPGYLAIGDDGGGRAIMLRGGNTSPVFVVGHESMSPEDMKQVAAGLSEWVQLGCPLDASLA
jgi:hypothetical protein